MTKKLLILLAVLASFSFSLSAQPRSRLSEEQLRQGLAQLRDYKHKTFVKELGLSSDQEQPFFEVYDKMDAELMAVGMETRELERKTMENARATDTECAAASRALFEQRKKEGEIELRYYDRIAEVLTPRQLLKLKSVERAVNMRLAKYHGRHGKKNAHKSAQKK